MKNVAQWLQHLEALNAKRVLDSSFKLREQRLGRLEPMAQQLDLLHWSCPVITVAGTNGKGSCVGLLTSILKEAGYRVASYTSPHLLRYNERIQVNHRPILDEDLLDAFEVVEQTRGDIPLGYFEFSTLAALFYFKQVNPDVMVLEVGMGGRFDPVNMIDSDISLISSVDFDHTEILGNTLEAIAFEKAGIMRANKPCVWGNDSVPANILDYANQLGTPLFVQNKDFGIDAALNETDASIWEWWSTHTELDEFYELPKPKGIYLPNAACVLQVIELLQDLLPVPIRAILRGLEDVSVLGRFQKLPGLSLTILDVAHNPASATLLAHHLSQLACSGRIIAVVGMMANKAIQHTLLPLVPQVSQWYLTPLPVPKSATSDALAKQLDALSVNAYQSCPNVIAAYEAAVNEAQPNDVIVVFGSFHTVAGVLGTQM